MNKKSILLSLILFAFIAPVASALTNSTSDSAKPRLLMERKEARQDFQKLLQEKKTEMRLKIQTDRAEFKEKLSVLKDTRKKTIAERIDLKLSTINQNSTNRMSLSIVKLETLLDKFSSRAAVLKSEGKDTAEADLAIIAAEAAIASAKESVATQAAQEYVAEITDETTLKGTFGQEVKALRQDLKTTHDILKNAKQKVMDVARALAKLYNGKLTVTPGVTVEPSI